MNGAIKKAEYITDIPDEIDDLIERARKERNRDKKRSLLFKAQDLIDAYTVHVRAGGNNQKQFNFVI